MNLKILGIIGGMGPMASCYFYRRIIEKKQALTDSDHVNCYISNITATPDRTAYLLDKRNPSPYPLLKEAALHLKSCGADTLVIICNTSHVFLEELKKEVHLPFLNIIQMTVDEAKKRGVKKLGIMATKGTIENKLYQNACERVDIQPVLPSPYIETLVMKIIYSYVKRGSFDCNAEILEVTSYFRELHCDSIVLGCTELSILPQFRLNQFYIDPIEIVSDYCVTKY